MSVFAGAWTPAMGADTKPLVLMTEENPPYNFTDPKTGRLAGLAFEKVVAILGELGHPYEVRVAPWSEAYSAAQSQPNTCVFLINLTDDRRPLFQWVSPLSEGGAALFSRADWDVEVRSLEDLRPFTTLVQSGSAAEQWLIQQRGEAGGFRLVARENVNDLTPLVNGQADLYASGVFGGPYVARQAGVPLRLVYRVFRTVGAMACSPTTDPALVAGMQRILDRMNADGRSRRIESAYRAGVDWGRGAEDH